MPWEPNTYCVNPLQSKPFGSAPPFRYGLPRSESAVPVSAYMSTGGFVPAASAGSGGGTGGVTREDVPPGTGNGRGTKPVDAQAPVAAAAAITSQVSTQRITSV